MSLLNKVKRFFYNPYVAIRRNPYRTALWGGLILSAALYTSGLLFLATPGIIAAFTVAGIYTTAILAMIAAVYLTATVAIIAGIILMDNKLSGLPAVASIAAILLGGGYGVYAMYKPLMAALAAANPLSPLITLGIVVSFAGVAVSALVTKLITSLFDIDPDDYHYIQDDDDLRRFKLNHLPDEPEIDQAKEYKNSNALIADKLVVDYEKELVTAPDYHDGINLVSGQQLDQPNHDNPDDISYDNDIEAALNVAKLK